MGMKWLIVGVLAALALAALIHLRTRQTARGEDTVMTQGLQKAEVEGATVTYEPNFRELATVHYRDIDRDLKAQVEWVGWGTNQKSYLVVEIPASS